MSGDDEGIVDRVRSTLSSALGSSQAGQGEPVTVVSGLPRSGTSMMMQILERGGLEPLTDHEREPDADNPEGYYELERVKALPEGDHAWLDEAEGRAVKVISALLEHLPEDHTYQVVFMRRDIDEVLASQRRMLERLEDRDPDEQDDAQLREQFLTHLDEIEAWARERSDIALLSVSYNEVVEDPASELERVAGFLDAPLDVEAMVEAVDRDLYRQRGDGEEG